MESVVVETPHLETRDEGGFSGASLLVAMVIVSSCSIQ